MDKSHFGRLERVDLRKGWQHEAHDFTPWLAHPDNLALLSDTVGLDLELQGTEESVGRFSADIFCKDTLRDEWVLIENQLERTNHTHLGQLLTYAAGLDAVSVIWVARRFTEEHRAALDWLNTITTEGVNFFGIEIELWRIGSSPVAPKFNLVSKPNNWSKAVAQAARGDGSLSDTQQLYLRYWQAFSDYFERHDTNFTMRAPLPRNNAAYSIGRAGCEVVARIIAQQKQLQVELYLKDEIGERLFHLLRREQNTIEEELAFDVEWLPRPDHKSSIVRHSWKADPTEVDDWPNQHNRFFNVFERYRRTFAQRLQMLDPSAYGGAEEG